MREQNNIGAVIAQNIRYYLKKLGMSRKELAQKLGVSISTVTSWLNYTRIPHAETIDNMCRIFNCNREDLLTDSSKTTSVTTDPDLTNDEFLLLLGYQHADPKDQHTMLTLAKNALKKIRKASVSNGQVKKGMEDHVQFDGEIVTAGLDDKERVFDSHIAAPELTQEIIQ